MTSEQRQKLSELTEIAVENNDIDSLIKIRKIIEQDEQEEFLKDDFGIEWFLSYLTPTLQDIIFAN